MLIVGDGDFVATRVKVKADPTKLDPKRDLLSPDYEFVTNSQYPVSMYSNIDFFMNAFEDLMGKDKLMELRRREFKYRPLNTAKTASKDQSYWKFINVVFPILVLLVFGVIQYIIRRKKFAKS